MPDEQVAEADVELAELGQRALDLARDEVEAAPRGVERDLASPLPLNLRPCCQYKRRTAAARMIDGPRRLTVRPLLVSVSTTRFRPAPVGIVSAPDLSVEIGAAAPSGGLDHVGFSQEARAARARAFDVL